MKFGFDVSGVLCDYYDCAMPDAIETVSILLENNHEVYSVSGGSGTGTGTKDHYVLQDYENAGVRFTSEVWGAGFKAEVCSRFMLDMLVDDDKTNLRKLPETTQGIYYIPRWSDEEGVEGLVSVRNWQDIRAAITAITGVTF